MLSTCSFCTSKDGLVFSLHKISVNLLCQAQPILATQTKRPDSRPMRRVGLTMNLQNLEYNYVNRIRISFIVTIFCEFQIKTGLTNPSVSCLRHDYLWNITPWNLHLISSDLCIQIMLLFWLIYSCSNDLPQLVHHNPQIFFQAISHASALRSRLLYWSVQVEILAKFLNGNYGPIC